MIYTGLNRTGEIETVKANGSGEISEVYGGIGESNPIYYKQRDMVGTSPMQFKALGLPLKDYRIYGETLQDGTPSPEAPVDAQGAGERTENLFDGQLQQGFYAYVTGNYTLANTYVCTHLIPCTDNTTYTFRCINTGGGSKNYGYIFFDSSQNRIGSDYINMLTVGDVVTHTATTPQNTAFLAINIAYGRRQSSVVRPSDITGFMLNLGSTALPYEPYGYKLPVTIGNTTTPIYIGSDPLYRIGDYADEVDFGNQRIIRRVNPTTMQPYETPITSTATIPQLTAVFGDNTLTVDTTVKPSAVSITSNIKPTGYGQLLDANDVDIRDSNSTPIFIRG